MSMQSLAWLVTFGCIMFSARVAAAFLRHSPRLFTVMALFACTWTLVQGFYRAGRATELTDLITDLASFLLVYAGGLLMLEGTPKSDHHIKTAPLQSIALILLLIIAAPKEWSVTLPGGASAGLNMHETKTLVSYGLILAASISIGLGIKNIASKRVFEWMAVFLMIYSAAYGWYYFNHFTAAADLTLVEYLLFAFLKIVFTVSFGCIVAYRGITTSDDRDKDWRYLTLHFFYLAGRSASVPKHTSCPLNHEPCKPHWTGTSSETSSPT